MKNTKYKLAVDRKKEVVSKYGGKNLSKRLRISHPAVSKWKVIPPFRAIQISKLGDINFWINSKAYNFVENTHQVWLLTIVDLIIGKREYSPN